MITAPKVKLITQPTDVIYSALFEGVLGLDLQGPLFWQLRSFGAKLVSRVAAQNSLRGVGVGSKPLFL